jgi:hypothetical protein
MSVDTSSEQGQLTKNVSDLSLEGRQIKSVETSSAMHTTSDRPASQPLTDPVWTETAVAQSTPESAQTDEFSATDAAWLLLPLWFAIVWVVLFFAFSEGFRFTQSKLKKLYTSSAYLKCAVNPLDAATERAIACSDYDPKQTEDSNRSTHCNNDVKFR